MPNTLYLGEAGAGEAGRDVRDEKLLKLGFVAVREAKGLVLREISNSATNAANDCGILRLLNAGGCENSNVAAVKRNKTPVVECDDLQTALAVAAFYQWNSLESIRDSHDRWRSYIAKLQKELDRNTSEWNEIQALFTVDQERFIEANVRGP